MTTPNDNNDGTDANPLDYKKLIIPRSFEKDWSPKDPRIVMPRMRQVVAFNNNI